MEFDSEYLDAMMALAGRLPVVEVPNDVTVDSLRARFALIAQFHQELAEQHDDVIFERFSLHRLDGSALEVRWYTKAGSSPGSAAVYVHGGGMVMGDLEIYHPIVAQYVGNSGVPMLAVEYRVAPEHPYPAALDDVVTAISWLQENGAKLGVDPARIAVLGDSGGGGIAAAVALACRDRYVSLAAQILVYPMLDDRNREPDPVLVPFARWTYENNAVAWDAVIQGAADVSPYASPARATDLSGLPRTYLDTGELDIFRAEILDYAARLTAAGVSTELHVHPGVPHGFEMAAPHLDVSRRALADRYRVLRSI